MNNRKFWKARREAKAARNAQIVERIKAGEKRYMLAAELELNAHTIGKIAAKAGLQPFCRFRQPNNQRTEHGTKTADIGRLRRPLLPA